MPFIGFWEIEHGAEGIPARRTEQAGPLSHGTGRAARAGRGFCRVPEEQGQDRHLGRLLSGSLGSAQHGAAAAVSVSEWQSRGGASLVTARWPWAVDPEYLLQGAH